jgi:hypothetical protein
MNSMPIHFWKVPQAGIQKSHQARCKYAAGFPPARE